MAMAERFMAATFNRPGYEIINHFTYAIVSDGDLMEGISHEAASLAGHLGLGKLIYLYDDNHISIEGSTDLTFTEKRTQRFEAYGWHVQQVEDGNDPESIARAIVSAQKETHKPSFIAVRTHIGYGSPNKQDKASAHGEPLGKEELKLAKLQLGWPLEPEFHIPDEALKVFRAAVDHGKAEEAQWASLVDGYRKAFPDQAREMDQWIRGELPQGWEKEIPSFPADPKGSATRASSGTVLNALAKKIKNMVGGSADLAPSNQTLIKGEGDFQPDQFGNRNLRFGVREHGMGAILNGMALHGGVLPYGGTFLIFSDYMRPAIRLAALMRLQVIYVFTHDSIGLGEDGPTHQPVEQLAALRAIPNLTVLRPCDASETAEAWRFALSHKNGPTALVLTRQGVPVLDRSAFAPAAGLQKGAYVLADPSQGKPEILLMASGSEVALAIEAAKKLEQKGIAPRVVSMPSWELFDRQTDAYRQEVFPSAIKARIAVEAGRTPGWWRYVGDKGEVIGIDHFGASAPYKVLYEKFGITADRVVEKALKLLGRS
jgi:transketolase